MPGSLESCLQLCFEGKLLQNRLTDENELRSLSVANVQGCKRVCFCNPPNSLIALRIHQGIFTRFAFSLITFPKFSAGTTIFVVRYYCRTQIQFMPAGLWWYWRYPISLCFCRVTPNYQICDPVTFNGWWRQARKKRLERYVFLRYFNLHRLHHGFRLRRTIIFSCMSDWLRHSVSNLARSTRLGSNPVVGTTKHSLQWTHLFILLSPVNEYS